MTKGKCEICGKPTKSWFKLCYDCSIKEKQKPKCEVCGKEVQEGHDLCLEHWKEKRDAKKKLKQIDYVKTKKEIDFREKTLIECLNPNERVGRLYQLTRKGVILKRKMVDSKILN